MERPTLRICLIVQKFKDLLQLILYNKYETN